MAKTNIVPEKIIKEKHVKAAFNYIREKGEQKGGMRYYKDRPGDIAWAVNFKGKKYFHRQALKLAHLFALKDAGKIKGEKMPFDAAYKKHISGNWREYNDMKRIWESVMEITPQRNKCTASGKYIEFDNLMEQNPSAPRHQKSSQESHRTGSGRQTNQEIKKKVEHAAVEYVKKHYEHQRYKVESVEEKDKGWDLEARKDGFPDVLIEVKGRQSQKIDCELTHNEYTQAINEENFRLAVVTSALGKEPCLRIFQFKSKTKEWTCCYGKTVKVHQELRTETKARIYEKP